jgi:hypothetical protein
LSTYVLLATVTERLNETQDVQKGGGKAVLTMSWISKFLSFFKGPKVQTHIHHNICTSIYSTLYIYYTCQGGEGVYKEGRSGEVSKGRLKVN